MGNFSGRWERVPNDDRSHYENVTNQIVPNLSYNSFNRFYIETSDIELILHKADQFRLEVFMLLPNELPLLHIQSRLNDSDMRIAIACDKHNIKAYVNIYLPFCDELTVKSAQGDIKLLDISAGKVKITSLAGDVLAKVANSISISIKTDSGNIDIVVPSKVYKLAAKSKDGDVIYEDIKSISASEKKITCLSSCGDILIKSNRL